MIHFHHFQVACETIRFSLQNGICEESASAYVIFAYFQIFLKQGFGKARRWGSIAKSMLEKANAEGLVIRTRLKLFGLLWFWYTPLEESRNHLQKIHDLSLKVGETESAYISMCIRLKFSFFRGEQLSIVAHSFDKHLKPMVSTVYRYHTWLPLFDEMLTVAYICTTSTGQV